MKSWKLSQVVLLVEDDPSHIALARRAFSKHEPAGRLIVVHDGQRAIELLQAKHENAESDGRPDLVVLDLGLPGMHGLDVLRALKSDPRTRRIPVVVCTVTSDERERALDLGANSFVVKPVDEDKLFHALRVVGEYWLENNEFDG